ncbi:hypothetical protein C0J52_01962 [Blattella germanica]|nr:hypothetical protein C0J52_01962 [Blattella germanica]
MADIDVCIRQRSVIEFLNADGESPIPIHERLKNVYGDATVYVRQWVRRCNETEGQTTLADEKRSGRPVSAVTPHNTQRVDELIRDDHRITREELCRIISISKGNMMTVIQKFVHGMY